MAALITTVSSFTSQYFEINQVGMQLPLLYTRFNILWKESKSPPKESEIERKDTKNETYAQNPCESKLHQKKPIFPVKIILQDFCNSS